MKKLFQLLFISSLLLSFISCIYEPQVVNLPNRLVDPTIENVEKVETPKNKKHVNTLMVCYMDGDNDIEQAIKSDLREARDGYSLLKNTDDVDVLVLWDGYGIGDSSLFRLARNNRLEDISEGISWLRNTHTDGQLYYEVSMNDYKTLSNYLSWVKDHYSYENIILQLSDHGVGPGTQIPQRALCQDWNTTNGTGRADLLGTEEIARAIRESGIEHIDLIIEDVCLGGTIEEAYAFNGIADYILLSPNLMPGTGLDYEFLVSSLSTGNCVIDGKLQIEKYLDAILCHFMADLETAIPINVIEQMKNEIRKNNETLTEDELNLQTSYEMLNNKYIIVKTLTGIKLQNISNVKSAVDDFVASFPIIENTKFITSWDKLFNPELKYYQNIYEVFSKMNKYKSNMSELYDIGMFCDEVIKQFEQSQLDQNIVNNIKTNALKLKESLKDVIVCSWRDGVNGALYNKSSNTKLNSLPSFKNGSYGLLISGPSDYKTKEYPFGTKCMNPFYVEDLSFGRDSKWNDFCNLACEVSNKV